MRIPNTVTITSGLDGQARRGGERRPFNGIDFAPTHPPMTYRLLPLAVLAAALTFVPSASAQDAPRPTTAVSTRPATLFDPAVHLRTADVRVGMKGYGLSVFKGTDIEKFDVEVLAVLHNSEVQMDTDVILIRASGQDLEHTGPIAGMSGSPIYLRCDDGKDRLVGAFAFGWPLAKDPVAGVQPIEQMLRLDPTPRPRKPDEKVAYGGGRTWDALSAGAVLKLRTDRPTTLAELLRRPDVKEATPPAGVASLRPLSLPISVGGVGDAMSAQLADVLRPAGFGPMLPLDAPTTTNSKSDNDKIAPGSALIVPVLLGDLNLVATGTATAVIGDKVFGFGHPMFNEGQSDLPFAAGSVDATIATLTQSFKLGSPGKTVGTLASDATVGVAGTLGKTPATIPISLHLTRADGATADYHFESIRHPTLTPTALAAAAGGATSFRGNPDPEGSTRWDVRLKYAGGRTIHLADVGTNAVSFFGGGGGFVPSLILPVQAIALNPFGEIALESVDATVTQLTPEQLPAATIEEVALPRRHYKPGETVKLDVGLTLFDGGKARRTLSLKLPDDLPPGDYPLSVGDSTTAVQATAAAQPFAFQAKNVDDIFRVFDRVGAYPADALYLRLDLPEQARVAVGRQPLANLPASRTLLLAESGRSDVQPFMPALTQKLTVPFRVDQSRAEATITVTRK